MFGKFNFKMGLKIVGMVIFGLLILSLVTSLGGFAFRTVFNTSPYYQSNFNYAEKSYMSDGIAPMMTSLSVRNVVPERSNGYTSGDNLEDFEITEYNAWIKTNNLDKVCSEVKNLKARSFVIFEKSGENNNNCNYRFKVKKENEDEILQIIRDLKPENLSVNTASIKKQITDFTSEEEILTKKLAQIEETLQGAQDAYNEVSLLAIKSQDAETLAKIISSKIALIEKLTTERLNTKNNLDRLSRAKLSQLDRLQYTFFTVNVSKNLIIDFKALGDSWERELKNFVHEFNGMLQGISVKLLSFGMKLIQVLIYLALALLVTKYSWKGAKFVWKR